MKKGATGSRGRPANCSAPPRSPPRPQVFLTDDYLVLAMEYAPGGDLFKVGGVAGLGVCGWMGGWWAGGGWVGGRL